jgi:DNA invertase Pin-like site-specific DNA recombinase
MKTFIAYYRVSTPRQGVSGLGLEAQRTAVARFVGSGTLLREFTEIESGKAHANRPQLLAAIERCRKTKATLIIAKVDRLSRNVSFISTLMDGAVDLVFADMPGAGRLELHIMASIAEHEREAISARTKAALAAAKARGVRLGNPRLDVARKRAREVWHAHRHDPEVIALINDWQDDGDSLRAIADRLNKLNIPSSPRDTRTRGRWHGSSVRNALREAI